MTSAVYRRLLPVFIAEAEERLDAMFGAIGTLATAPDDAEARRVLARAVHTIKGNAAALGLAGIVGTAEDMERRWPILGGAPSTASFAELYARQSMLRTLVREVASDLSLV